MIKSPSWNHRAGFRRRGLVFQMGLWRFYVPLSWWFIWFFTLKGIETIHLSSKNWWKGFRVTYDVDISLVPNPSISFANTLLSRTDIWINCLYRCCINIEWRWRTKIMRLLTWSGQCCWNFNHNEFHEFLLLCRQKTFIYGYGMWLYLWYWAQWILWVYCSLIFSLLHNAFIYWKSKLLGDTVYPGRMISG